MVTVSMVRRLKPPAAMVTVPIAVRSSLCRHHAARPLHREALLPDDMGTVRVDGKSWLRW
jgi:hypothetical protein